MIAVAAAWLFYTKVSPRLPIYMEFQCSAKVEPSILPGVDGIAVHGTVFRWKDKRDFADDSYTDPTPEVMMIRVTGDLPGEARVHRMGGLPRWMNVDGQRLPYAKSDLMQWLQEHSQDARADQIEGVADCLDLLLGNSWSGQEVDLASRRTSPSRPGPSIQGCIGIDRSRLWIRWGGPSVLIAVLILGNSMIWRRRKPKIFMAAPSFSG